MNVLEEEEGNNDSGDLPSTPVETLDDVLITSVNDGSTDIGRDSNVTQGDFSWGDLDGNVFSRIVDDCYNEVVHWKRNIFLIPSGGVGKAFVDEVARLFQSYADNDAIEPIRAYCFEVVYVDANSATAETSQEKQSKGTLCCSE